MISTWTYLGLVLISVLSGVLIAVAMAFIGGMGVLIALRKRLESVEISQENLDRRLTTEVKARASGKAVEARTVAKSIEEEARVRLQGGTAPNERVRPSVFGVGRR